MLPLTEWHAGKGKEQHALLNKKSKKKNDEAKEFTPLSGEAIREAINAIISVKLPEKGLYIPVVQFVKYLILLLIVLFIALRAYQISKEYLKKATKTTKR